MSKRNSFSVHFFIKKHRTKSNGESPIYLRISLNGRTSDMSLFISINHDIWDTRSGTAIGLSKKAKNTNSFIESTRASIFEHYKFMRETHKELSPQSIKNAYMGIKEEDKGKKVLELFREHNDKIKALENIDYSPETVERYEVSLRHTHNFMLWKYKKEDLFLTELDHDFIVNYELYFKTVRNCSHNTTMKYIRNFKKIINLAIANGDLNRDPFVNFKIRLKKVDRGFLTEEEIKTLLSKKFKIKRLEQVRDCFVFACFTGLAHSDLKRLSSDNIVTGTDGNKWIKINRKKTENLSSIPLLDVTEQLIMKYKNDPYCKANNVILPVLSNQKMNAYLKEIADLCGIEKNFTSHLARHTFATTITLNNNVPLETVSKMLGHSSINMTRVYARLLDEKVGNDMEHLKNRYSIQT